MKKIFAGILLIIVIAAGIVSPLHAQSGVDDFVIRDFFGRYELFDDAPGGRMNVVERISLDYAGNNRGILRSIPASYKGKTLELKVNKVSRDGQPEPYEIYESSGNKVIKIGEANTFITGEHDYEILYSMRNIISFGDEFDEFFWDINGTQWKQPFENVTAEVVLPDYSPTSELPVPVCFTGTLGSQGRSCTITPIDRGYRVSTTRTLKAKENMSVVIAVEKDVFRQPTALDWLRDNVIQMFAVVLPPILIGRWAFRRWFHHGKDLKSSGIVVPHYQPPKDLSAAEAGLIMTYKLDSRFVSAVIIDLAVKKYIRIYEKTERARIAGNKRSYEFELINADFSGLREHEIEILNGLFKSATAGEKVTLKDLKHFHKTIAALHTSLPKKLTNDGYFSTNPATAGNVLYGTAFSLGVASFFLFGIYAWLGFGLAISAVLTGVFATLMPKRTQAGVDAKNMLEGLRLYMETAEKDRLKMMHSSDAKYAQWNKSHEPVKTVELFEKLLPFAIVLGTEKSWAREFEGIYETPPDWYSGNWTSFNTGRLVSSVTSSVGAMNTSFSPPSSSSGSGFGGGGSSGGGGGGGGGGGW
jgi:uncharacterized membrane protein YgcG